MTEPLARTTGTVTFLFSDIEGSTRLEQGVGTARYAELRERHRAILRDVWAANDGIEQGTEGDSFFVVFPSARSAVAAAVAGQRALAAEPWPADGIVKVRMGLHTGEAEMAGGSLVGLDINQAARIAAVAHGGQILASDATRGLVSAALPPDVRLRDLGTFRLKDLLVAERLVAVLGDGLPADFPPPRTPDAYPNNLPTQLTTFVGRDQELEDAAALLQTTRLLTLTGPGGTGKTRLSIQLGAAVSGDFPDGVFFVPLEPVRDPLLVASRIASSVGVAETASRPIADSLGEWLRDRTILLVLDNFEQVAAGAPVVGGLLRDAAALKVVVTSRAALRISGEQEFPVDGLSAPPSTNQLSGLGRLNAMGGDRAIDAGSLGQYAAVRLFIERAVAVRPGFSVTNENAPAVAAITTRLHGLPLAIELAAARTKLLTPDAILARLEHQLDVLSAGARDLPARQQTLRGAIAWSYDLLDPGGRLLLDRLSVFVGGCDLAAAEAVCGPSSDLGGDLLDGVMALADQSLVKIEAMADGEPRIRLLDTIREYAAEQLDARGETARIQVRHRDWFVALAETASKNLAGADQRTWLDRLEMDHDDIRAVLDRAVAAEDGPTAIGLAYSMWRFWQKRGHLAEARLRLETIEAAPWSKDDPRLRARLLEALGGVLWWQGEPPAMGPRYEEALAIWEGIGDEKEIANAHYNASFVHAVPDGDGSEESLRIGLAHIQAARDIYHRIGDVRGEANALWALGNVSYFHYLPGNGADQMHESIEMFRSVGDVTMEAWSMHMLGTALLRNGDEPGARAVIEQAIRAFHAAGDASGLTLTIDDMSAIATAEGDLPRAARLRGAARNLTRETGAQLAGYVEDTFETGIRPGIRSHMDDDDLARYGAEGAALTLDAAVAFALGGPFPGLDAPGEQVGATDAGAEPERLG